MMTDAAKAATDGDGRGRAIEALGWIGWALIVLPALVRAVVEHDPTPYWSVDPTNQVVVLTGIGPTAWVAMDAAMVLGLAALVIRAGAIGKRVYGIQLALLILGALAVVAHLVRGLPGMDDLPVGLDHLAVGSAWVGAMACAFGGRLLGRDPRMLRLAGAAAVGVVALIAARGAGQYFIEHAATVAAFEADPAGVLAQQGLREGTPQALSFERRLRQPEATGWFGLSNVAASFGAAGLVACGAGGIAAQRKIRRDAEARAEASDDVFAALDAKGNGLAAGGLWLGVALSLGLLLLTASKGGFGAMVFGAGATAIGIAVARRSLKLAGLVGLGCVAGMLLIIGLRGAIGTQIGELSLLYRALYAEASLNMWADHLVWGVGPDGFQEAYGRYKDPVNPETVASPHSVFFDWTSRLGVLGLAWVGLLVLWAIAAAKNLVLRDSELETDAGVRAFERRLVVLLACVVGFIAAFVSRGAATGAWAASLVIGIGLWSVVALGLLEGAFKSASVARIALAGAALTLIVHSQIEVTPVWLGSAALWGLLIGLGASAGPEAEAAGEKRAPRAMKAALPVRLAGGLGLAGVAGVIVVMGVLPLSRWEGHLRKAARTVEPIADLSSRTEAARREAAQGVAEKVTPPLPTEIVGEVAGVLGEPEAETLGTLFQQIGRIRFGPLEEAGFALAEAVEIRPGHGQTVRSANLVIGEAAVLSGDAFEAESRMLEALGNAYGWSEARPGSSSAFGHASQVAETAAGLAINDPDARAAHVAAAVDAADRAARLDPWSLTAALRAFTLTLQTGDERRARDWAAKALERDEALKLDPVVRMSEDQRAFLEAFVRGEVGAGVSTGGASEREIDGGGD